jgi:hypothetical protein
LTPHTSLPARSSRFSLSLCRVHLVLFLPHICTLVRFVSWFFSFSFSFAVSLVLLLCGGCLNTQAPPSDSGVLQCVLQNEPHLTLKHECFSCLVWKNTAFPSVLCG